MARAQAPSETAAIDAFLAVRGWLDRDSLPPLDAPEARVEPTGTSAVALLLRADGRVVGRGEDATGDALMVRRAAGRAVAEALGDATIRAVRTDLGDRVTVRLSLEIELAGPTRPLLGRTVAEASARIVPGAEGIALLKGDEVFRAFPARLLANDSADRPDATITGLMRAAGLPAKELREFGPADRVSLGRFDTIRLRQGTPDSPPSLIVRGGRLVELAEITPGSVRALSTQLAARLSAQVIPLPRGATGDGRDAADSAIRGLLGTYNPTADAYDPAFAGVRDEAFAALALASAARCAALPEPTRARAAESARRLADALRAREDAERGDAGDAMTLLVLRMIAGGEAPGMDAERVDAVLVDAKLVARVRRAAEAMRAQLAGRPAPAKEAANEAASEAANEAASEAANEAASEAANEAIGAEPEPDGATLETAAIAAAALTAPGATPEDRALAGSIIDALLARTTSSRGRLADAMLPLGITARSNALPDTSRAALTATLGDVAAILDTLQLLRVGAKGTDAAGAARAPDAPTSAPADFPPDLVGGFALPGTRAVLADAQGLRIAAALALLRRPEKSDQPFDPGLRASLRFLAQHVADEPWTEGFRRPEALRGLVRASLASDDCPPAATAAGLLLAVASLTEASD